MENERILPKKWYIARLKFIEAELQRLPEVTLIRRGGVLCIRRSDKSPREISQKSKHWNEVYPIAEQRQKLEEEFKLLKGELKLHYKTLFDSAKDRYRIRPNRSGNTFEEWSRLGSDELTPDSGNTYHYKGHDFRSRFEIVVAQAAERLNLKYKYEPRFYDGNDISFPDLVFGFEELNCFSIFEVLGRLNKRAYVSKNCEKMEFYINMGYYPGRELFYVSGNDLIMPSPEFIETTLISMIAALCELFVEEVE